jgi:hypothetical protein
MASIPKALNWVLKNYGHDILLQRRVPGCTSEWQSQLERHTVRHMYPSVRGAPQIAQEHPEGMTHVVDMVYYFRFDAAPKEGDRIYEIDPRYEGSSPSRINVGGHGQTTWVIDYAIAMRGKAGKVEYYIAGVTREEPN